MLKSFWKLTLCAVMVAPSSRAIAQDASIPTQQLTWSIELPGSAALLASDTQLLVVESGRSGEPGILSAVEPTTGNRLWKSDRAVGQLFAIEKQTVYADDFGRIGRPGSLLTFNVKTGKTQSVLPINDPHFAEVIGVSQGAFIYRSYLLRGYEPYQNKITAQTTANKVLWTFNTPPESQVSEKTGRVQDGVVVLPILIAPKKGQRGYHLTALNAMTGKLLWQWKTEAEIETVTLGDTVYASIYSTASDESQPGWVKAFDLRTGRERWTHRILGGLPEMTNDHEVFVLDRSEKASTRYVVLDRQTGAVLRQFTLARSSQYGGGSQLAGKQIYKEAIESTGSWTTVENYSRIEAFDATDGKLLWQTPPRRGATSQSVVIGNHVIVVSNGFGGAKDAVLGFKIP